MIVIAHPAFDLKISSQALDKVRRDITQKFLA